MIIYDSYKLKQLFAYELIIISHSKIKFVFLIIFC